FALLSSIGAGLLAGLAPALQLTSPQLMEVLKNGSAGTGRWRARTALVVAEIALAFVLAAGAGLMIRTLSGLLEVPTGLAAPERVLVTDLDLPQARYPEGRIVALAQDLLRRALDRREDRAARGAGERGVRPPADPARGAARPARPGPARAGKGSLGDRGRDRRRAHPRAGPRPGAADRGAAPAIPAHHAAAGGALGG